MVTVEHYENIFEPPRASFQDHGKLVFEYATSAWDLVYVDGKRIFNTNKRIHDAEKITFVRLPHGPAPLFGAISTAALITAGLGVTRLAAALGPEIEPPDIQRNEEPASSNVTFEDIRNTIGGGHPVPFIYGEHRTGGHHIDVLEHPTFDRLDTEAGEVLVGISEDFTRPKAGLTLRIGIAGHEIEEITDILVDGNPIADLKGIRYATALGTANQRVFRGFDRGETVKTVDTQVTQAGGAVTAFTDVEADSFEIRIRFKNGLFLQADSGKIVPYSVTFTIEYREYGTSDAWVKLTGADVTKRAGSIGVVDFIATSPRLARAQYEVRVTRVTTDNPGLNGQFASWYYELIADDEAQGRAHPGVPQIAIENLDTDQSGGREIRRITSKVKGYNKIRVYTDLTTYTTGYTENPAWICADFITNTTFGVGRHFTYADLDLQSFLDWAEYCDESVPDGLGPDEFGVEGTETRATYGFVHDTRERPRSIISQMGRAGDAVILEPAGGAKWRVVIDKNSEGGPVGLFCRGNIERNSLRYSPVPFAELATKMNAHYTNVTKGYRRDIFGLEDDEAIVATQTHVETTINLFGCTRRSQVARILKRHLNHNKYARRQVSFTAELEAVAVNVWDLIAFASEDAAVGIATGRVTKLLNGGFTVYLDRMVRLESGKSYELTVHHIADDTMQTKPVTEVDPWIADYVTVSSGWASAINVGDLYSLGETGASYELFRVLGITREADNRRGIVARLYDDRIYDDAVIDLSAEAPQASLPLSKLAPVAVTGLNAEVISSSRVSIGWSVPSNSNVEFYSVWLREPGGQNVWGLEGSVTENLFTILDLEPSTSYDAAVIAVSTGGNRLAPEDAPQVSFTTSA